MTTLREAAKDVVRLYLSHNHPDSLYTNEDWFKAFDALWEALKSDADDTALLRQAWEALRQCRYTTPPAQRQIVKDAITALEQRLGEKT